jgi:adenine deaminase
MFCTDDKHPDEILTEGHIDFMVNKAIELGVPPIVAIQMATINAAKHFRIEHLVGSLTPGRWADVILAEDLHPIIPDDVFFKGKQVVRKGELVVPLPSPEYPDWLYHTIKVQRGKHHDDYILRANGDSAQVWVIDLYPDQIINEKIQVELNVQDGAVQTNVGKDILKLAVVERYGKNGNIGIAFVRGFGIKNGALASSVAHDHHNIIVAGTNDADMALCVKAVDEMQGGLVIASEGQVIGALPLPIGGLLSELPVSEIIDQLEAVNQRYRELGGTLPAPFMTLSFIGLPTVPQLGMTDYGLVDVLKHKVINTFVE